jgi:hypothetical protein
VARGVVAVFFIHLDRTPQGLASIYKRFPGPCRSYRQPSSYSRQVNFIHPLLSSLRLSQPPRMSTVPPPETRDPWAPNMVYRPRRPAAVPQTLCELYIEQQVVNFFRFYLPLGTPNHDYGPTMERATKFVVITVRNFYAKGIEEKDLIKDRISSSPIMTSRLASRLCWKAGLPLMLLLCQCSKMGDSSAF